MIDEDRLREKLREPLERSGAPAPDLGRVRRRARALRARRLAGAVVACLVLVAGVVVPLTILSSIRGGPPIHPLPAATGTLLRVDGLSVDLPDGWDGRAYRNPDTYPGIVQFADRPLTQLGPTGPPDDDVLSATRAVLGADQVAVVLRDVTNSCPCPGYRPMQLPVSLGPQPCPCGNEGLVAGNPESVHVDPSHSFARAEFVHGGRWFDLWADFGSQPAPESVVADVNSILGTLSITPAAIPGAYQGWTTHFDLEDRVAMDTPDAWGFHTDPVPALLEPKIVFAAGTEAPIPQGGDCGPDSALKALPSDGALVWMNEYTNPQNPSDFPDRPQTLSLGDLSPTPLECIGERTYFIRFADQGRYFQFNAVIGPGAPDSLRHDVVTAMNTFAPVPDDSCVQSAQLRAPGAYQPSFSSSSGAPGEAVTVSGFAPFPPRTEGGAYVSPEGTRAEVWWNDGGSGVEGAAAATGQATELGFADTSGTCAYRISFTVPDVGPGVYPVTVRDASPNGFSWYGEENFTVTG